MWLPVVRWADEAFDELFIDSLWSHDQRRGGTKTKEEITEQWYRRPDKEENILGSSGDAVPVAGGNWLSRRGLLFQAVSVGVVRREEAGVRSHELTSFKIPCPLRT